MFTRLFKHRAGSANHVRRVVPCLETMEERLTPAGAGFGGIGTGVGAVMSAGAPTAAPVAAAPAGTAVRATGSDTALRAAPTRVDSLDVMARSIAVAVVRVVAASPIVQQGPPAVGDALRALTARLDPVRMAPEARKVADAPVEATNSDAPARADAAQAQPAATAAPATRSAAPARAADNAQAQPADRRVVRDAPTATPVPALRLAGAPTRSRL